MFSENVLALSLINPIGLETYLDYVHFKDAHVFYKAELGKTREKIISYQKRYYYAGSWKPEYEELVQPLIGQINGNDWPLIA